MHGKPMQCAVTHMHAHQRAACQQKRQQVPQIQLEIDRRHQQREQRHTQHQAGAGRQDVHGALRQRDVVGQGQAVFKPGAKAVLDIKDRIDHFHCSLSRTRERARVKVLSGEALTPTLSPGGEGARQFSNATITAAAQPPAWRAPAPARRGLRR